jgi:curved DNA-binding protein CbpA
LFDISINGEVMASGGQKNYYELLEVDRDASLEEIRAAYARKVRACTPLDDDGEPFDEDEISGEFQALLKVVTAAFSTLSNQEKRAEYDKLLPKPLRQWEEDELTWGRSWAAKKILSNPEGSPYAFGTFGVVKEEGTPPSAFDLIQTSSVEPERRGLLESLRALVRSGR